MLLSMLDDIRIKLDIPTQACVLAHVTTTLELIRKGSPVDLVFQSIAGTEPPTKASGSTSHCWQKRAKRRLRSAAARSATM